MRPTVGSTVLATRVGRVGTIAVDDGSDLPFKVVFDDGAQPGADWLGMTDVSLAVLGQWEGNGAASTNRQSSSPSIATDATAETVVTDAAAETVVAAASRLQQFFRARRIRLAAARLALVALARRKFPGWAELFAAYASAGDDVPSLCHVACGRLSADKFLEAMRSAHPRLSAGQASALWRGFTEGTQQTSMDIFGFCSIADVVATDDHEAAEFADMNASTFMLLGAQGGEAAAARLQGAYRAWTARRGLGVRADTGGSIPSCMLSASSVHEDQVLSFRCLDKLDRTPSVGSTTPPSASVLGEASNEMDMDLLREGVLAEAERARAAKSHIAPLQATMSSRDAEQSQELLQACRERDEAIEEATELKEDMLAAQAYRTKMAKETQDIRDHNDDPTCLLAKLDEKDEVIRQIERNSEARSAALAAELADLRQQVHTLSWSSRRAEVGRRGLRQGRLVTEDESWTWRPRQGIMQARNIVDKTAFDPENGCAGRHSTTSIPFDFLRETKTLADLGLDVCSAFSLLDRRLRRVAEVLFARADARLAFAGTWLVCHVLYMSHVLYVMFRS